MAENKCLSRIVDSIRHRARGDGWMIREGRCCESDEERRDPHALLLERHRVRGLRSDLTNEVGAGVRGFLKNDQKNVFLITKSAKKNQCIKSNESACMRVCLRGRMNEEGGRFGVGKSGDERRGVGECVGVQ